MSNIQIQQYNGSSYTNLIPEESVNADTLDGYHADSFLMGTTPASTTNLNVWVNIIANYTFQLASTSYSDSDININFKKLYLCNNIKPRGGIIGNSTNYVTTECYITSQITDGQKVSFDGKTYIIRSDENLILNSYNSITQFSLLKQIILIDSAPTLEFDGYSNYWYITRTSTSSKINYTAFVTEPNVDSKEYEVTSSSKTVDIWQTESQCYIKSKSLLEGIAGTI